MAAATGRIPQGEVIVDFADGGSYIKSKLEDSVLEIEKRRITKDEGRKAQSAMEALNVGNATAKPKAEDVDYIVQQIGCSRTEAEQALTEEKNLVKALIKLVKPTPRAKSVEL